jgi:nitrogen fixation protein FixH
MISRVVTGRHVLIWLLASFAVVFAANGAMIYYAIATMSGEVESKAYLTGLSFNETLAALDAQRARGWRADVRFAPIAGGTDVRATYAEANGRPATDLAVRATFIRPTRTGDDFEVALAAAGNGTYGARVALPQPGLWDVHVVARRGTEAPYRLDYRVVAK